MGWLSTLVGTLFIICLFPGCVVLGALWHNAGISLITPTMLLLLTLCNAPKLGTTVHCTAPKMGGIIEAITTLNGDTLPAPDSYKTLNNLNSVHKQSPKLKNNFSLKQELFQVNPIEHTGSHDCGNHLSKWNSIEVGRNRNGECLIRAIHHPEKCLEAAKKVGWGRFVWTFWKFSRCFGAPFVWICCETKVRRTIV